MACIDLEIRPWNLGLPLLVLATACGPKVEIGEETSTDTIDPTNPSDPSDPSNPSDPTDPTGPNQCESSSDCDYGYICIDGQCTYDGYCDDGGCCYDDCCYDECCYDGCWYECYSDEECGPGEVCEFGYCTPGAVAEECPSTPEFIPIPLPEGTDGAAMALAFVQTDDDAARELVVATPAGAQLVDAGNSPVVLPVVGAVLEAVAADLDGDGDDDLVLAVTDDLGNYSIQTLVQDGAGAFDPLQTIEGVFLGLSAGDLTGDGFVDVGATTPGFANYDIVAFASGGGQLGAPELLGTGYDMPLTATSSVDGDTYADLAAHLAGATRWWRGGPSIDPTWDGELDDASSPLGLHGGDVDGDGVGDFVTVGEASQGTAVTLWAGQFGGPQSLSTVSVPIDPWSSAVGDIDGDTAGEVAIGGGGVVVFVRSSFGQIDCYSIVEAPHDVARLAVGDYDGDGVGDVAVSNGNTTTVLVRLSN